jgi:steroid delta-isomerase-like uncharacterized protein
MSSHPPAVLERLVEAMRTNDPEQVLALYTDDCHVIDPAYDRYGHAAMLEALQYFFRAFRIERIEVVQTIEEGNSLAVVWEWDVIHQGDYLGVPPSGRLFETWNVMVLELRGDKIASDRSVWDASQYLRLQALASAT